MQGKIDTPPLISDAIKHQAQPNNQRTYISYNLQQSVLIRYVVAYKISRPHTIVDLHITASYSGNTLRQDIVALDTCYGLLELGKVFFQGEAPEKEPFIADFLLFLN